MPFITVKTNKEINNNTSLEIKQSLREAISLIPGKSEAWLMIEFEESKNMFFKGTSEDVAMIEVKVYGKPLNSKLLNNFTSEVTNIISRALNISTTRIYISYLFTEVWGYNGENF